MRFQPFDPFEEQLDKQQIWNTTLGSMDVAADQSVDPAASRLIGDCRLEVTDILHGILDLMFYETRKRPVVKTELTPYQVHETVGLQQPIVGFWYP
jgi:hypothetical protein